jgi:pimeloyl-ACP methyl ester carboxylesterase
MAAIKVRDVSLFVEVVGHGYPLLLMHGGPGADHHSLRAFRRCADRFTLVFYDHRCNGRSQRAPVTTMTWENLTADADALRDALGFERWAVLGHSFGGHVALEYALRYPGRVSRLILLDTGADSRWSRDNAPKLVIERGHGEAKAEIVRRFFHGELAPGEMLPMLVRIGDLYSSRPSLWATVLDLARGEWRTRLAPEALIFAGRHLLEGWSVMDRLGEIAGPTLVIAGRDDFLFPPEHQREMASAIPQARLLLVDRAGHNPHTEQPAVVMPALRDFLAGLPPELGREGALRAG